EEDAMAEAARMAVSIGASLVDINMGCPAKRVVAGECGSALMKEPERAQRLVRIVVDAVPANIPVTVKHRAGWNDANKNAPELTSGRPDPGPPGLTERVTVFRRHVDLIEALKTGPRKLHEVRKACAWYARGLYGCNALRLRVWEAPDMAAARALVEDYFAALIDREQHGLSAEGDRATKDAA